MCRYFAFPKKNIFIAQSTLVYFTLSSGASRTLLDASIIPICLYFRAGKMYLFYRLSKLLTKISKIKFFLHSLYCFKTNENVIKQHEHCAPIADDQ